MFEMPEIMGLARQIDAELQGAMVTACERGNTPHKWAWYSGPPEFYEEHCIGSTIGKATSAWNRIFIPLSSGYTLAIGDMGGQIRLLGKDETLPRKRHLMLGFAEGRHLIVKIQGWGGMWLLTPEKLAKYVHGMPISPLSPEFTFERFVELLAEDVNKGKRSVKAFMASQPSVSGIGNGYVQDICFEARLHPRRDIATLSEAEKAAWHKAMIRVLRTAAEQNGRDTETDLYGNPGGFTPKMDRRTKDQPCPECGTTIEKIQYLGGSCYFCPSCQELPASYIFSRIP